MGEQEKLCRSLPYLTRDIGLSFLVIPAVSSSGCLLSCPLRFILDLIGP